MSRQRMFPLLLAVGALNLVLLTMPAAPAYAEKQMATGHCQWCIADDVFFACCRQFQCGGEGQPNCTCHTSGECSL